MIRKILIVVSILSTMMLISSCSSTQGATVDVISGEENRDASVSTDSNMDSEPKAPDMAAVTLPLDNVGQGDPNVSKGKSEPAPVSDDIYIADAAMYRGTVTKIEESDAGIIISLTEAVGTNFGSDKAVVETMNFLITESTSGDTEIKEGDYMEVFYGRPMTGEFDYTATHDAIGMNKRFTEAMVIFNGTIKSIDRTDGMITRLSMIQLDTEQEVVFNVSDSTQLYLNADDLKEGDKLNIYHKGIYTRSLPPQGIPLEIRPFAE